MLFGAHWHRISEIFTDDCTSEMMVKLLKDNDGRMALISAEGGAFDAIIGRYSKKPNLDVWLKGICGDTIRVDRLNREPDYVRHPAVSMILTAQPSVLSEIMQNGMLDGRGFLARFLYVNIPPAAVCPGPFSPRLSHRTCRRITVN